MSQTGSCSFIIGMEQRRVRRGDGRGRVPVVEYEYNKIMRREQEEKMKRGEREETKKYTEGDEQG